MCAVEDDCTTLHVFVIMCVSVTDSVLVVYIVVCFRVWFFVYVCVVSVRCVFDLMLDFVVRVVMFVRLPRCRLVLVVRFGRCVSTRRLRVWVVLVCLCRRTRWVWGLGCRWLRILIALRLLIRIVS